MNVGYNHLINSRTLSYVAKMEEITPYAWLYKNIDDFRWSNSRSMGWI